MEQKKLVPKRRFKEYSGEWKEQRLGDLAEIVRGASPRPIQNPKWFDNNSNVGWLRISDVTEQNGRINYLEQRLSSLGQEKTRVLNEPHLLLSIAATVGKPVINYVETGVHDGFLIFNSPKFDREFMFQWLEMFRPMWSKYGQPGSQVNLNSSIVKEQKIVMPNLEKQQKIGQFFKHLDEMITLEQRKIDKIKALKSAYLSEMFPAEGERVPKRRFAGFTGKWKEFKFENVVDMFNNLRIPVTASKRIPGDTPYYGANGIQDYVKGSTHDGEYVLIAEDGANDLNNYPVQYVKGKVWVNNHAHVITGKNNIVNNLFLVSRMKSMDISKWLVGGGRAKLNAEVLKNIQIKIPCFEEQKQIGLLFRQLDKIIATHQQKLDKLKATKQAYLHEMFV